MANKLLLDRRCPEYALTIDVVVERNLAKNCVHVRRITDGYYLMAYDNRHNMYWAKNNQRLYDWDEFTVDNNDNKLITVHGTCVCYDATNADDLYDFSQGEVVYQELSGFITLLSNPDSNYMVGMGKTIKPYTPPNM